MKHTRWAARRNRQSYGWLLKTCLILILAAAWLAPAEASAKEAETLNSTAAPDVPGDVYWAGGFEYPGMDSTVNALALGPDRALYAGGWFKTAGGVTADYVARWDGATWQSLDSRMNSAVFALAFGTDGSLYAGGRFTAAGGGSANRIARWDGAAWHPLGSGMNGDSPNQFVDVRALAVGPDGSLYAGGLFDTAGGVLANGIARWDGATWHPLGTGMGGLAEPWDPTVYALAFGPDGSLYAGGRFTEAGGAAANYIALWDGATWHPLGSGMGGSNAPNDPTVFALAFGPDGSLYAGGGFAEAGGVAVNGIARWDPATFAWHPLGSGISGGGNYTEVDTLLFGPGGSLFAGGRFTVAGGLAANYIARWDGTTWQAMGSGMDAFVFALAFGAEGSLYAGGRFITAGDVVTGYIARWDQAALSWRPLLMGSGMTGPVYALAVGPDGSLYAGGAFITAGGVAAKDIARWDLTTSSWQGLGSGTDDSVHALAFGPDGSLYAGGHFTAVGGTAANNIARWDGAAWHPLGSGISGNSSPHVYALAFGPDGSLYAGGRFTVAGGVTANYIARWDGIAWHPLDAGMGGYYPGSFPTVGALVVGPDGSLYAGGAFKTAGGEVVNGIARWDGSPWQPLGSGMGGFYPPSYPAVSDLAFGPDGSLYAGGRFTEAGGVAANYIARWDGAAWHPLSSGMNGNSYPEYLGVSAIAFGADGSLYAAGWFNSAGGVVANSIARWDGTSWHPLGSGLGYPGWNAHVSTLAFVPDGSLYVGGDFTTAGGKPSSRIARWATPNVIAPIEQPGAGTFVTGTVVLSGFAIDLASTSGTGIDRVHIYLDGPFGTGTIIGGATYGLDRPDVAAQYGARFGPSGWELPWDTSAIAPGVHTLTLYAHRTLDNRWSQMAPHLVVVHAGHITWLPLGNRNR